MHLTTLPSALLFLLSTSTSTLASSFEGLEVYPRSTSLTQCLQSAGINTVTSSSSNYQSSIGESSFSSSRRLLLGFSPFVSREVRNKDLERELTNYVRVWWIAAYNQRIQPKPIALVKPTSPQQVSSALKCAKQAGVATSARSGGHSYGSYGLGGTDGSLVIDLVNFKKLEVDSSGK